MRIIIIGLALTLAFGVIPNTNKATFEAQAAARLISKELSGFPVKKVFADMEFVIISVPAPSTDTECAEADRLIEHISYILHTSRIDYEVIGDNLEIAVYVG